MRTYGTYRYINDPLGDSTARNGTWALLLEPAQRMRAKRIFGRVRQSRHEHLLIAHTTEVARDITWFMDRFPLTPHDDQSRRKLEEATNAFLDRETTVGAIIAGTSPRPNIPVTVTKTPRDYQLQALHMLATRNRILLGDEVGLGKTFTSLLATTLPGALPALVVPPTHLPPRWVTELEEAFPNLTYEVAKSSVPGSHIFEGHLKDVTIVPYSKLMHWSGPIAPHIRTVIFDEAQELRHGADNTKKGAAAALVSEKATYAIGATATPVYNYGSEIWNITDILSPGELGTRDEFLREWGGYTMSNGRSTVRNPAALGSYMRENGYLLARTRTQVGRELPKTIKHTMHVDMDPTALQAVQHDIRALAERILADTTDRQDRFQAAGEIDWKLRQATGVGKAPYIAEFCKLLLQSEQKIIIWAWHRDVYEILLTELADYNPRLYTGTESPKQKAAAEAAFKAPYADPNNPHTTQQQLDTQCRILIMSLRSGAGVDGLEKVASVGVFAELDWSPQVHEQAIGRLRRDGMNENTPAIAYFLVTEQGSDPALMEVLGIKRQQSEPMINPDGTLLNNSTTDPARAKRLARQVLGLPPETTP